MTADPCHAEPCGTPVTTRLIAGQHIDVGVITVVNDENFLYVTYTTDGTWNITETHLDVATSPEELKQTKKGNAIPGQFAYATNHNPGVTEVTHTIDTSAWPEGTPLYLAAHAVVVSASGSETAWGEGIDFPGKNWAMYFGYDLQLCGDPPVNPGIIEFQDPNLTVMENVTLVQVTLVRTDGSDGDVSVDIISSDISATVDEDYALPTDTTVVFDDGDTEKVFEVFILNDELDEEDELFQLQLTNIVGAEIGQQDTATITIVDDDEAPPAAVLLFAQPEYTVMENAGSVTIEVIRQQSSVGEVTVDFNLIPDSATPGTDYVHASGTLVFADGETAKTIVVQIVDDLIPEFGPEQFIVELSNPVGATVDGTGTVNVTIMDDDIMIL